MTDSTPLARAKEEGDAEEKARRRPMTRPGEGGWLRDSARKVAKGVFNNARDAGVDVGPMKERMAQWMQTVELYAADIKELNASTTIVGEDRDRLLRAMYAQRDKIRAEIFGG